MKILKCKPMFLLLVNVLFTLPAVGIADIAMIASTDSTLASVDKNDVKLVYLGKRSKILGVKVIPVSLPAADATTQMFLKTVVSKTAKQYKSYWARIVFTGKGAPPPQLNTPEDLKAWVTKNPGAIGFIDSKDVNDTVKVIGTF